jgi:hypothetical protein
MEILRFLTAYNENVWNLKTLQFSFGTDSINATSLTIHRELQIASVLFAGSPNPPAQAAVLPRESLFRRRWSLCNQSDGRGSAWSGVRDP